MKTLGRMRLVGFVGMLGIALAMVLCGCADSVDDRKDGSSSDSVDSTITAAPQTTDSVSEAWQSFWTDFRKAVRDRDSAAIAGMMAPGFEYGTEPNPSLAVVFRELAYGGGENWRVLDGTLDHGTQSYDLPSSDRPARIAIDSVPCGTPPCRYQSWAIFRQEADGRWCWAALLFPGD